MFADGLRESTFCILLAIMSTTYTVLGRVRTEKKKEKKEFSDERRKDMKV